jgi:hypothetical protein
MILCCHDIFAHDSNHVMTFFVQILVFFHIHVALHNLCFRVSNIHLARQWYVSFNVM